jgi:hypothetical protein
MKDKLAQIVSEIDLLTLEILGPLRSSKTINQMAIKDLYMTLDRLNDSLHSEVMISKNLVGKVWFIFTSMLAEAEHARNNREEIEIIAWNVQEKLRRIFGPTYEEVRAETKE